MSSTIPLVTYVDPGGVRSDNFGFSVSLSSSNVLIGAYGTNPGGKAYLYSLSGGNNTHGGSDLTYSATPASDVTLSSSNLTDLLANNNVTLQANTDLTLAANSDLVSTSSNNLTLQAGRSIILDSSINTNGGNLTLIANDTAADGVVAADRDPGAAVITMAVGTNLKAGTRAASITLNTGNGVANSSSGAITLNTVQGSTISVVNQGTSVGSDLILNGQLTSTATTAQSIKLAVYNGALKNFYGSSDSGSTYTPGSVPLVTNRTSSWLVQTGSVAGNVYGLLRSGNQALFNTAVGSTVSVTGNRYTFAQQPSITIATTDDSKTYGQTKDVSGDYTVSGSFGVGYTSQGFIDASVYGYGATHSFTQDTVANTVSGLSVTSSGSGSTANVQAGGYAINGTGSSTTGYNALFTNNGVLTINAKPITVVTLGGTVSKTYDGTTTVNPTDTGYSSLALSSSNILAADQNTVTVATTGYTYSAKDQGLRNVTAKGLGLSGNGFGDYTLVPTTATETGAGTINAKQVRVSLSGTSNKSYDGTPTVTNPSGLTLAANGVLPGDTVNVNGPVYSFDSANVGNPVGITAKSYSLSNNDYVLALGSGTIDNAAIGSITQATLTLTANPVTRTTAQSNPIFNGRVTGFIIGDTLSNATTGTLVFTSLATSSSPIGSYAIDGSGLIAPQYLIVQALGNATALTITKVPSINPITPALTTLTYNVSNPLGSLYQSLAQNTYTSRLYPREVNRSQTLSGLNGDQLFSGRENPPAGVIGFDSSFTTLGGGKIKMNRQTILAVSLALLSNSSYAQDYPRLAPKPVTPLAPNAQVPSTPIPAAKSDSQVLLPKLKGLVFVDSPKAVILHGVHDQGVVVKAIPVPEPTDFQALTSKYLGATLTRGQLNTLIREIIVYYRNHDRPIVDVIVPQQDVSSGTVQLVILESKVDKITATGNRWIDPADIRDGVRLASGDSICASKLQDDLDWLNSNPFHSTTVIYHPGEKLGATDIELKTQDRFPVRFYAGYEDSGNAATGFDRYLAGFNWGDAFFTGQGQQLNYQYTTSGNGAGIRAHSGSYVIPLPWRHSLTFFGSYADTRGEIPPLFGLVGRSFQISGRYNIPLPTFTSLDLGLNYHETFSTGFDYKFNKNSLEFGGTATSGTLYDVDQFVMNYNGILTDPYGQTTLNDQLYVSPGNWGGDNNNAAFAATHTGATSDYVYNTLVLERLTRLPEDFSLILRGTLQTSNANLVPSEQLGFGGYDTVRGYDEREVNTDDGYIFTTELRSPTISFGELGGCSEFKDQLQLLAFWDYGSASNHTLLPREADNTNLSSIGGGVRYSINTYLSVRFDYGIQLLRTGLDNDHGSKSDLGFVVSY